MRSLKPGDLCRCCWFDDTKVYAFGRYLGKITRVDAMLVLGPAHGVLALFHNRLGVIHCEEGLLALLTSSAAA